jgi:hypothetical protein
VAHGGATLILTRAELERRYSGGERDFRHLELRDNSNPIGAEVIAANLTGIDLAGTSLSGAVLDCDRLTGADMRGIDLSHAHLDGAQMGNANLSEANLRERAEEVRRPAQNIAACHACGSLDRVAEAAQATGGAGASSPTRAAPARPSFWTERGRRCRR